VRSAMVMMVVGVLATPAYLSSRGDNAQAAGAVQETPAGGVVQIIAPIVLDISEDGKSIGSTNQSRLTLRPGKHVLTLSNAELGYTYTHTMDIESGDVRTITINPRASATLRAKPWAEVWLNGTTIGKTPFVHELPLGTHELVFKHPKFGERRVTIIVRADGASPATVDMRQSK
jgi:PEGA domain-containing protein